MDFLQSFFFSKKYQRFLPTPALTAICSAKAGITPLIGDGAVAVTTLLKDSVGAAENLRARLSACSTSDPLQSPSISHSMPQKPCETIHLKLGWWASAPDPGRVQGHFTGNI